MKKVCSGIKVYTASDKNELDDLFTTLKFDSDLAILVDFGIIVSQKIIDTFPLGIVNSHFSLLPELRGADPISFAILEGKRRTGVSLMLVVKAMDEGPLLSFSEYIMSGHETSSVLTNILISLSHSRLSEDIPKYRKGTLSPRDQPKTGATYTRKLSKRDGILDWTKSAETLEREIRAFQEWPKSRTSLGNIDVIVTKARPIHKNIANEIVGEVELTDSHLAVSTSKGKLVIERLKPSGKKEMDVQSFLLGYKSRLGL